MTRSALHLVWLGAALLAGCALELENTRAARDVERNSRAPGSVYAGWRVYQDKCARCHGADATGRADAPDLVARVRTLGPREFADLLLLRYEWATPPAPAGQPTPERRAYLDDLVQRRQGALVMPAWQGEPRVNAHVIDLYAYLGARADGTQGPGRPAGP